MRGEYLCKFYLNGHYTEETIFALNTFVAKKIMEARYSDNKFRWASLPQLERNSISRF
jgi:hypothetical protein